MNGRGNSGCNLLATQLRVLHVERLKGGMVQEALLECRRGARPFLASRSGRVVTREEILDAIWGTDFMAESNVVWGVLFKDPSLPGGLLALAATLALIATAKADEAECTRFFGPAYRDYMQRTRMFVPFLF